MPFWYRESSRRDPTDVHAGVSRVLMMMTRAALLFLAALFVAPTTGLILSPVHALSSVHNGARCASIVAGDKKPGAGPKKKAGADEKGPKGPPKKEPEAPPPKGKAEPAAAPKKKGAK